MSDEATTATFLTYSPNWERPKRAKDHEFYNLLRSDGTRLVPKTLAENIEFRRQVIERGCRSKEYAADLRLMCQRDLLFWINTFCYIKEPRKRAFSKYRIFPWLTWPIQDWWLTHADELFGMENIITPKSRGTGATWMMIALFLHQAIFFDDVELGLVSSVADNVDQIDNPSTLFGKIDVLMRYMPAFLIRKEDCDRGPMRFVNRARRSSIHGSASTGDLFRGHRKTAVGQDESAAFLKGADEAAKDTLREVTDCNIDISTLARDDSKKFNRIAWDPDWPGVRLSIRWWECPPMAAGLYTCDENSVLKTLDAGYVYPPKFPFKLDAARAGQFRSPWYDRKTRGMKPDAIAREYDVDREAGRGAGLDQTSVKELLRKQKEAGRLDPLYRGVLAHDVQEKSAKFRIDPSGQLLLWCPLVSERPVINEPLSFGCDVSGGTGASNAVVSVFGMHTGKQWAEYASAFDDPIRLARFAASLGWWMSPREFGEPLIVAEKQGPGGTFYKELKNLNWTRYYKPPNRAGQFDLPSQRIGYAASHDGPYEILAELIDACVQGRAEIRSEKCFAEFSEYVWKDGKLMHVRVKGKQDPSEGAHTHGDRACAAALAWVGASKSAGEDEPEIEKEEAPWGSLAWAREHIFKNDSGNEDYELLHAEDFA